MGVQDYIAIGAALAAAGYVTRVIWRVLAGRRCQCAKSSMPEAENNTRRIKRLPLVELSTPRRLPSTENGVLDQPDRRSDRT
jgi:hypothetical protein